LASIGASAGAVPENADAMGEDSAAKYVRLVVSALGQHERTTSDAYYGARGFKREAEAAKLTLDAIGPASPGCRAGRESARGARRASNVCGTSYLEKQCRRWARACGLLKGGAHVVDEESKALYDASRRPTPRRTSRRSSIGSTRVPRNRTAVDDTTRGANRSSSRTIGSTPCSRRPSRRAERTLAHVTLPPEEQFTVEYVTNKIVVGLQPGTRNSTGA